SMFPTTLVSAPVVGPAGTRVFGTGGSFNIGGFDNRGTDLIISPFKVAFDSKDRMLVTNNPYYTSQNFAFMYLAPDVDQEPTFSFSDFLGYAALTAFDANDNLYVADF